MRDPNRIHEINQALVRAWLREPDTRLGQLIAHEKVNQYYDC